MARSKQHPMIGKYTAQYQHAEYDEADATYTASQMHDTPEAALNARVNEGLSEGDVVYVYAVVGVKVVRKPTLTENLQ
jgi:hypothetical protein